jgi:hypothetical protein
MGRLWQRLLEFSAVSSDLWIADVSGTTRQAPPCCRISAVRGQGNEGLHNARSTLRPRGHKY